MDNAKIENEPKKKVSIKTIFTIIGNVLFYLVIILLFLFSLMNINAGNGETDFPNLFGKGILNVQSDSMERDSYYTKLEWANYKIGEIKAGDLVHVNKFKDKDVSLIKVGDVITFVDEQNLSSKDCKLNTHRVVFVSTEFNYVMCQGDKYVSQYGDGSNDFDKMTELEIDSAQAAGEIQLVSIDAIKGIVTKVSHGTGKILTNIRQNWLFYFVIPVAVVLIIELFFVFKNILDLRNEKAKVALADDAEAMKNDLKAQLEAEMRQKILAELEAQKAAQATEIKPAEEPKVEDAPIEEAPESNDSTEEVVEEKENTEE